MKISSEDVHLTKELLGRGKFADIFKGFSTPSVENFRNGQAICDAGEDTRIFVAVKLIRSHTAAIAIQEAKTLQQLGPSKHIMGFLGLTYLNGGPAIVVEFCENGDLLTYLRTHLVKYKETVRKVDEALQNRPYANTDLSLVDLVRFSWQISDGMTFLRHRNYVHRGLCAAKVFVTTKLVVKISGFGLARYSDAELHAEYIQVKNPMKWMAPESLAKPHFTMESDVWSYGVLLYEIFSAGHAPYEPVESDDVLQFLQDGRRLEQPPLAPVDIYRTMLQCWDDDPEERPTAEELRHILSKCLRFLPGSSEPTDTDSDTSAHYAHIY